MRGWQTLTVEKGTVELPQGFNVKPIPAFVLRRSFHESSLKYFYYVHEYKPRNGTVKVNTYTISDGELEFYIQLLKARASKYKNRSKIIVKRKNGKRGLAIL
jgi:hypothetical protein